MEKGKYNILNFKLYYIIQGGNASTTGNIYGVYDMAGGAWEYTAAVLRSYKSMTDNYDLSNSNKYQNKYFDWYDGNSSDRNTNYNVNTRKYGDAVYETSNSGNSFTSSWDSSLASFPKSDGPVFRRGGNACDGSSAGNFAFASYAGGTNVGNSFRPVVISVKP